MDGVPTESGQQGPGEPCTMQEDTPSTSAGQHHQKPEQPASSSRRPRAQRRPRGRSQAAADQEEPPGETEDEEEYSDQEMEADHSHRPGAVQDELEGDDEYDATSEMTEAFEADPLYDPEADDQDEKWLREKREGRESDAILSCPGCFTTVCIDCQQHSDYKDQYRAMFVMNCVADTDKWIAPSSTGSNKTSGRKRRQADQDDSTAMDPGAAAAHDAQGQGSAETVPEGACHPVMCEMCDTQVGVVDPVDGLYILYNVFPSQA